MLSRRRCAVLGSPIAHSLSPVLHRAGYAATGLDWTYEAVEVAEADLPDFIGGLDATWRGLSLTMPLKRAVLPLLAVVKPWARASGAANTVIREDDGTLTGDNTDVPGAVAAVAERVEHPVRTAAVLGGGATGGSMLLALAELGCERVTLLARDPARVAFAHAAGRGHPRAPRIEVGSLGNLAAVGPVDLLVSTIPAEAQADLVGSVATARAVFDVVYDPWPTPFALAAGELDIPMVSGLDLLVHQAAVQFTLMTGADPAPLSQMRAAGEAALARRTA